jgi:hypothetical protein
LTCSALPDRERAASVIPFPHIYVSDTSFAWQFVRANLPAILAKASPHGRAYVLPEAAAPAAEAARADELIALTRANLEPGAYYQAEKTADWIQLKA